MIETHPPRWREAVLVLVAFGLLSALEYRYLLGDLSALYSTGRDYLGNLWNLWWVQRWLSGDGPLMETDLLFYPHGSSLAAHTLCTPAGLLAAPLLPFLGPAGAYHVLWLLSGAVSAWAGWLLARVLTGSRTGAAACGVLVGFGPYHAFHFTQLNHMFMGWLPLALLAGLYLVKRPGPLSAAALAVTLAVAGWTDWYEPLLAGFALLVVLPFWITEAERWRSWRFWAWLGAAGAFALLLVLPLALATAREIYPPGGEKLAVPIRYADESDLIGIRPTAGPYIFTWPVCLGYLGCLAFLLSLPAWGRRKLRPWWILLIVAFLFLQGTRLSVLGRPVPSIPLPMQLLEGIPVLENLRVPHRFLGPLTLSFGLLGAFGLARWRLLGSWRGRVAVALPALLALEMVPRPSDPVQIEIPPFYQELAADPGHGAVLELPLYFLDGYPMYLQTIHGHPLLGGYLSYIPPASLASLQSPLFRALLPSVSDYDVPYFPEPLEIDLDSLDDRQKAAWRREMSELDVAAIVFRHQADWRPPEVVPVGLRPAALLPLALNPVANNPEPARSVRTAELARQRAEASSQARKLIGLLFGPPDRTEKGAEIWDLRERDPSERAVR